MTFNRTARSIRNVLLISAALALAVLPAAAAVQAQDTATSAASGSLMANGSVTPAPAATDAVSPTAADSAAGQSLAPATASDDADTSSTQTTTAAGAAASVPSDAFGSTEVKKVQRSCGAAADPHYVPARGQDSNQCYDKDGNFRSSRTYTATHYSNDVSCGDADVIYASAFGQHVHAGAGTDGGSVGVCDDGAFTPTNGRVTAGADADGSARVVGDSDKDNAATTGWASATVSADGPEYRCGKAYEEGGRGTADAPTDADNADQCSP